MAKTAILVDGGFYRKCSKRLWGAHSPEETATALFRYCCRHLTERHQEHELYRIFYYDCPPISKKMFHPLTGKTIDFGESEQYKWMTSFLAELKTKRKIALRLGIIDENNSSFALKYDALKKICAGTKTLGELTMSDFEPDIKQKGVDMKIGVDIASLSYKQQVEQIILIAGDSDFVPAAKLARREGVDFVLDSLGAPIKPELFEHIDGKRSCGNPYHRDKTADELATQKV